MNRVIHHLPTAARVLLGLTFVVFGLNGFFQFLPQPPMPDSAGAFVGALVASGYFFPMLKSLEVAAGLALLSGRFVPLALTVLAPVVVNIALFHIFLAPAAPMVVFLLATEIYLAWAYRGSFRAVLEPRAEPAPALDALPTHTARTA